MRFILTILAVALFALTADAQAVRQRGRGNVVNIGVGGIPAASVGNFRTFGHHPAFVGNVGYGHINSGFVGAVGGYNRVGVVGNFGNFGNYNVGRVGLADPCLSTFVAPAPITTTTNITTTRTITTFQQ